MAVVVDRWLLIVLLVAAWRGFVDILLVLLRLVVRRRRAGCLGEQVGLVVEGARHDQLVGGLAAREAKPRRRRVGRLLLVQAGVQVLRILLLLVMLVMIMVVVIVLWVVMSVVMSVVMADVVVAAAVVR